MERGVDVAKMKKSLSFFAFFINFMQSSTLLSLSVGEEKDEHCFFHIIFNSLNTSDNKYEKHLMEHTEISLI